MRTSPPAGALMSLEAALAALLEGLSPVTPRLVPLDAALGRVAAEMPIVASALPACDIAAIDGWACRALDLVGASAYSPLALASSPAWVETGDVMPRGCDSVLQADFLDASGPLVLAVGEATPGHGVRRAGEDIAPGRSPAIAGRLIRRIDLMVARRLGISSLAVRSPRVRLIDVLGGDTFSARFVADRLTAAGATVTAIQTTARDAASIAAALDGEDGDLLVLIGGTGEGRTDATAEALARRGALIAHRIALRPGGTMAIGRLGGMPVVALAGSPDQALGGFLAVVQPVLMRLSERSETAGIFLPLSRKIASAVGLCEIVLLGRERDMWTPLATGDFSLDAIRAAEAWLAVSGDSEGHAAAMPVAAFPLHDMN